jgi:hypothetical protein
VRRQLYLLRCESRSDRLQLTTFPAGNSAGAWPGVNGRPGGGIGRVRDLRTLGLSFASELKAESALRIRVSDGMALPLAVGLEHSGIVERAAIVNHDLPRDEKHQVRGIEVRVGDSRRGWIPNRCAASIRTAAASSARATSSPLSKQAARETEKDQNRETKQPHGSTPLAASIGLVQTCSTRLICL